MLCSVACCCGRHYMSTFCFWESISSQSAWSIHYIIMSLNTAVSFRSLALNNIAARSYKISDVSGRSVMAQQLRRNSSDVEKASSAPERHQVYMKEANAQMQKYHEARELLKQGKLKSVNEHRGPKQTSIAQQAGVFVVFLAAFITMPFVGKKIATDDEFREKWVPSWYDFTVKKPENPWTREELHEQMLQVQKDIHERAIAGEFTPEKLEELQNSLISPAYRHREGLDRSKVPKEWDKIHPGLDDNENVDESDA